MSASEIRAQARKDLSGKWFKVICLNILFIIATAVLMLIGFIPLLGLLSMILIVPLSYGYTSNLMKIKRGETENVLLFLTEVFGNFGKSWLVVGNSILKMLPLILASLAINTIGIGYLANAYLQQSENLGLIFVVLEICDIVVYVWLICRQLLLTLSSYIAIDNESMTAKEAVNKSMELMKGNRWKYIWLNLSFLGWAILATLTLGIGYIWLIPYTSVAAVCFYESLAGKKQEVIQEDNQGNNNENNQVVEEKVETTDNPIVIEK